MTTMTINQNTGANPSEKDYTGFLVWPTVSEFCLPSLLEIRNALVDSGLKEYFLDKDGNELKTGSALPKVINKNDAFKRTARAFVEDIPVLLPDGTSLKHRVSPLADKTKLGSAVLFQLERVIRNPNADTTEERQKPTQVSTFRLDDNGDVIDIPASGISYSSEEQTIIDTFKAYYKFACEHYEGYVVPSIVNRILDRLPTVYMTESLRFVPKSSEPTIRNLETFVKKMSEYIQQPPSLKPMSKGYQYNVRLNIWEAYRGHEEEIQKSLDDKVLETSLSVQKEIQEAYTDEGKCTKKRAEKMFVQLSELESLVKQYNEELGIRLLRAQSDLDIAKLQAMQLIEKLAKEAQEKEEAKIAKAG